MSWTNELENVYELLCTDTKSGLLPLYHSTAKAQIEIYLDKNGEFVKADRIDKKDSVTIIPVTEASGSRGNGIMPMPFADKLVYIAGDYGKYWDGKNTNNSKYFEAYISQLKKWCDSEHSHPSVKAVYSYVTKCELMTDLVKSNVLKLNDGTEKLDEKEKIAGITQLDCFVRFIVDECKTWEDKTLYESFIFYNDSSSANKQICYASGIELTPTYKHPAKIRNAGDKAKLISSNNDKGFTYTGRFANKEEAISVSYQFSQKVHNALKWLVLHHGTTVGSLALVVWEETLEPVPKILDAPQNDYDENWDDDDPDDRLRNRLKADFEKVLHKYLFGDGQDFHSNTNVIIMGLDSATTGRLSMSMYSEIKSTRFFENVAKWHNDIKWLCFNSKTKRNEYSSFSPKTIANCAFGTEQGKFIDCGDLKGDVTMRLIPCIAEGRKIPKDIVNALFMKASNPVAYTESYHHRQVLETACGIMAAEKAIKKSHKRKE